MKSPRVRAIAKARGWRPFDKSLGVYSQLHVRGFEMYYSLHYLDSLRK